MAYIKIYDHHNKLIMRQQIWRRSEIKTVMDRLSKGEYYPVKRNSGDDVIISLKEMHILKDKQGKVSVDRGIDRTPITKSEMICHLVDEAWKRLRPRIAKLEKKIERIDG